MPVNVLEKYNYVMSNPECFVVVTADLLWQDVVSKRGAGRLCFSSNGVDFEFFQNFDPKIVPDKEFSDIIEKGLPVLCYYGALASWFDYELLKKLSDTGKYSIVLIGIKYDDSFDKSKIGESENVHFLGPRDYKVLKYYARCADVLMIPFLINDITNSTSPVKLFEYMALGKPIVTTDMPECRKYESVLIGKSHEDFISKIETSLTLKNSIEYQAVLKKEARENDWAEKARAIISMLEEHETK